MDATLTPDSIINALSLLSRRDSARALFGSNGHQYRLHPPISNSVVSVFERQNSIALPSDYRFFITEIGNGGAGPAYGVLKFGEYDGGDSWSDGNLVGDLAKPFAFSESWNHSKDFWEREPVIIDGMSEEEEDKLMEAWDSFLVAEYWNPSVMNGAIPICHLGCALRQWLVVHGPQRGYMWDDGRADYEGLSPIKSESGRPITFEKWYLSWLQSALDEYAQ